MTPTRHRLSNERQTFRTILLIGVFLYPFWGLLLRLTDLSGPQLYDPMGMRWLGSVVLLGFSFLVAKPTVSDRLFRNLTGIVSAMIMIHTGYLLYRNHFEAHHQLGALMTLLICGLAISDPLVFIGFLSFCILGVWVSDWGIAPTVRLHYSAVMISAGTIVWLANRARFQLEIAQTRLKLHKFAADHSGDGMVWTNSKGEILYANAALATLLDVPLSRFRSMTIADIVPAFNDENWRKHWKELQDGMFIDMERVFKRSDGLSVPVRVKPKLIRFEGREYNCAIISDLTSIKAKEAELEQHRIQLVHASKMSSLGEMAAGMAHEINNPLAVIHGHAQRLEQLATEDSLDAPALREALGRSGTKIRQTADRIAKIIAGLRTFARDGAQDAFEVIGVEKLVEETLEFCRSRFSSNGISLRVAPIEAGLSLECRPVQLSQALLNLLNNALDAAKPSDVANSSPDPLEEAGAWVELRVVGSADWVSFQVADSGKGVSREVAARIFEPFFTTKEPGKGTGLGLSITSSLVRSHGGEIYIDFEAPNTTFVVRLPRKQGDHLPVNSSSSSFSSARRA